jgi:hypothetical protein
MPALPQTTFPLIVIHQMAKVASLSWVEISRDAAARRSSVPAHSHFITEKNLDDIARVLALVGERQTIKNLIIPRDIVRKGRAAAIDIQDARAEGLPVQLICGIRDPVARSLSLLSFLADFCGHRTLLLSGRDPGASVDEVVSTLRGTWESIYAGDMPTDSFGWLLHRMTGLIRTWFSEELLQPLGLDVMTTEVTAGGRARLARNGCVSALFYRVEDMSAATPANDPLLRAASDYLQVPLRSWPLVNQQGSRRRSQAFNERVRLAFRLPEYLLDAIYGEPIVRFFYQPEEIAAFRRQWSAGR